MNNFDRARKAEHHAVFRMRMSQPFVLSVRIIEVMKTKRQIRCKPDTAGESVRIEAVLHERPEGFANLSQTERTFNMRTNTQASRRRYDAFCSESNDSSSDRPSGDTAIGKRR